MISQIHIKNFKSIVDLKLDLGRINLFIGENGSGKSNILEAIGFLSSSSTNIYQSNSTLFGKGVRVPKPELFTSAFTNETKDIEIDIIINGTSISTRYKYLNGSENRWVESTAFEESHAFSKFLSRFEGYISYDPFDFVPYFSADKIIISPNTPPDIERVILFEAKSHENYDRYRHGNYINGYMIYSPETSFLRKFEEEGQVSPLGVHGEGLFSLLKSIAYENGGLTQIKECLELIDWYEDLSIPTDLMSNEYKINITDKYLDPGLKYMDQRSANEGFLFLLFYVVLFSSHQTPEFFAIDNIEASFNPKLISRLVSLLSDLSKKNNKQVLMTTHNPSTLDGMDLNDPDNRLFVVRRNTDGHTIVSRIEHKPILSTKMKLSEMWTKGFLGGLPENF